MSKRVIDRYPICLKTERGVDAFDELRSQYLTYKDRGNLQDFRQRCKTDRNRMENMVGHWLNDGKNDLDGRYTEQNWQEFNLMNDILSSLEHFSERS